MAEPFLSEIRIMSFTFPPKGWAPCNGQLLPINQNQALLAVGHHLRGDGRTELRTSRSPDRRARTPLQVGSGDTRAINAPASRRTR
jgi:microcystin-dependent protein